MLSAMPYHPRAILLHILAILLPATCSFAAVPWQPLGLGGHGGMFTPAISPVDGKLMMVNCDMSGAYISTDGGNHWRMIHCTQLRSSTRCRPAFHPADRNIVFAACGYAGLKVSRDVGQTWQAIGNLPKDLVGEIAIDPANPQRMLAGTSKAVWRSSDGGVAWTKCDGPTGMPVSFYFLPPAGGKDICFAATADGIWRSDDAAKTWAEKCAGLPWREIRSFAGGTDAATKQAMLYCAIPGKAEDGKYAGGVFTSADRGESWHSIMATGLNMDIKPGDEWAMGPIAQYHCVLTTNAKPLTVYALNANTGVRPPHHTAIYRSDDGGKTWRATFIPDPRFPSCNCEQDYMTVCDGQFYQGMPNAVAIDPANPDHILTADEGQCIITRDGGQTWITRHALLPAGEKPTRDSSWLCNGLVVTTTWNYYIDPFEPKRHYICYTDIGFARSLDAGESWKWWTPATRPLEQHLLRAGLRPRHARQDLGRVLQQPRHPQWQRDLRPPPRQPARRHLSEQRFRRELESQRDGSPAGVGRAVGRARSATARPTRARFMPACSARACTNPRMMARPGRRQAAAWARRRTCASAACSFTRMARCSCSSPP